MGFDHKIRLAGPAGFLHSRNMQEKLLDEDSCWQAVVSRDAGQAGAFWYGVITTGVFCRPGCAARQPKRENVRFYSTTADAERDGLRACRKCHPLAAAGADPLTARIRKLCEYMDRHPAATLTLAELGERVKLSPAHLQRVFKTIVGVSPKQYLDGARMRSFKDLLREPGQPDVTGSIFEAGYGSLSRVYEKTDGRLGMTPMEYREGGKGVEISWAESATLLGPMLVGATDRGLCFIQFGEDSVALLSALEEHYPKADIRPMREPSEQFTEWMAGLNRYLAGHAPDLRLPVHVRATAFQLTVWKYLQTIQAGTGNSYREVAEGIGQPKAARAVARACASNSVAIVIPCHRVIRGTGELGGYRWGLARKRALLAAERAANA